MLGRRVLPVKICSCPKRDMDREEKDTHLKKNTVFRRNKKCISQDVHNNNNALTLDVHNNNNCHHHTDIDSPPCKMIKVESSTSAETENINNLYSLPVCQNSPF